MKKLIIILIALVSFVACKKDKEERPSIQGKWFGIDIVENTYENNILTDTDIDPASDLTYDFQGSGILTVTDTAGVTESFPYSVESPTKLKVDGQLVELKNFTNSTVTLSFREVFSPTIYIEVNLNLKR